MSNIRTEKEKEKIVKDLLSGKLSWSQTCKKYNLSESVLFKWKYAYLEKGIDGLKSNTGKSKHPNFGLHLRKPKNKIEELELEIMKRDIEIARLKKGYMVKGWYDKNEMPILDDALLACEDITLTAKWEKESKEEVKKIETKKEVKYSCETGWVLNGDKCEYTHRTTPKPNCGYGLHYDSKNKQCYYEVDMEMGCPDFNGYSGSSAYYDETANMCYYAKNSETSPQGCISHGMWKDGACYGINTSAKLICEQGTEENGMCVVRRSASYTCDEGYDLSGNYCFKKDIKPATAN